ncbi:hypothetical protein, partial [uncultured Bacteroides sp.]|uniref:hypothetical protein n=1 Tax=uncultured Bacteroides sp. TaxID=162156 RepID=UPI00280BAE62
NYLCCDQALEDSKGAGRMGLTHVMSAFGKIRYRHFSIAGAKVDIFSGSAILIRKKMLIFFKKYVFSTFYYR